MSKSSLLSSPFFYLELLDDLSPLTLIGETSG